MICAHLSNARLSDFRALLFCSQLFTSITLSHEVKDECLLTTISEHVVNQVVVNCLITYMTTIVCDMMLIKTLIKFTAAK